MAQASAQGNNNNNNECHNLYLQSKLKTEYSELKAQLAKLVTKKNVNKIHALLQKFCLYSLDLDLIPTLLSHPSRRYDTESRLVLQYEDKKLLRLVYYLLASLAVTHNERGRYMDQIQDRMRADIATGGLRAIMAIKTFAGYHYAMTGQTIVLDAVRKVIKREEQEVVQDSTKKKGKGIFGGKKDKKGDIGASNSSLDNWYYYVTLFELRSRLVHHITPTDLPCIVEFMSHPSPYVATSAFQAAQEFCKKNLFSAIAKLRDVNAGPMNLNLTSSPAKIAWGRLCTHTQKKETIILFELHGLITSKEMQVYTSGIEGLLKLDCWSVFNEAIFEPNVWPPVRGQRKVIEVVSTRISELLEQTDLPFQHAAIRLIENLAEKFLIWLNAQPSDVRASANRHSHPLYLHHVKLLSLLSNSRNFVKLKILQALIWIYHYQEATELEDKIMSEIISLPPQMFDGVLESFMKRVQATPNMATNALHLLVRIFQAQPTKINPNVLAHIWKTVMNFGVSGNLKNIFDLLSSEHKVSEEREQIFNVFRLCCWALGEYSTTICGEGLGSRLPAGSLLEQKREKGEPVAVAVASPETTSATDGTPVEGDAPVKAISAATAGGSALAKTKSTSRNRRSTRIKEEKNKEDKAKEEKTKEDEVVVVEGSVSGSGTGSGASKKFSRVLNLTAISGNKPGGGRNNSSRSPRGKKEGSGLGATGSTSSSGLLSPWASGSDLTAKKTRGLTKRPLLSSRDRGSLWTEKMFNRAADELTPHNPLSLDPLSLSRSHSLSWVPSSVSSPSFFASHSSSLPAIRSPVMTMVLHRLEEGIFLGSIELRVVCVEAMAKIAFLSEFEVKLHLYSFFSFLLKEEGVGVSALVYPILQLLNQIFQAFEEHSEGVEVTEETRKKIEMEVSKYCHLPPSWSPLSGKIE